jgi:hypothetical protein
VLLGLRSARNRSSPRPAPRTPAHDVGATRRGLRVVVKGSDTSCGPPSDLWTDGSASGMRVPGDGGWTTGQTVESYGGAAFQTASACAWREEGASCVGKVRGDLRRCAGGSDTEVGGAGVRRRASVRRARAGALSRPKFTRSAPV